ncbi:MULTISPECIES: hypothetical protein [unclassified Duganella]|uniref:hypothetical protein n=1 Tax=unclassified Duganella TaxID=2636909 RepID=UPI0011C18B60|nr:MULTISPECIES: hypothetical protein [unclassified Duganella]
MRIGQIWRASDVPDGRFVLICGINDKAGKEVVHEYVPTRRDKITVMACTITGEPVERKFVCVNPSCFDGVLYALVR